ncbi:MAG: hypothetical protein Q4G69_10090 [Planctomycetia bacterium]|nr:hypothetical protein [Planctomycetia bacterium]
MKDYSDCPIKPTFFSESSWFRVSMPNRNVVFQKKMSISGEESALSEPQSAGIEGKSAGIGSKSALSESETALLEEKMALSEGKMTLAEYELFVKTIDTNKEISGKTKDRICQLRIEFEIEYAFSRTTIMEMFDISKRQASRLLSLLLKHDLIEKVKISEYVFKRLENADGKISTVQNKKVSK